jgi:hypothetical protein
VELRCRDLIYRCLRHSCGAIAGLACALWWVLVPRVQFFLLSRFWDSQKQCGQRLANALRAAHGTSLLQSSLDFIKPKNRDPPSGVFSSSIYACNFGPCLQRYGQLTLDLAGSTFYLLRPCEVSVNRLAVRADRLLAFLKSSVKGSDRSRNIPTDTGPRVTEHGVRGAASNIGKSTGPLEWWAPPLLFTSSTPHTPRATRKRDRARNGAQRAAPRCFNLPRL